VAGRVGGPYKKGGVNSSRRSLDGPQIAIL
jgi:hypothetical protein